MEPQLSSSRREVIIDAAVRVFARLGFTAATMDEVAREAQVSKGGLYRHFISKDDLYLIVMIDVLHAFHRELLSAQGAEAHASGYEALRGYIEAAIGFARRRDDRVRLLLGCGAVDRLVDHEAPSFAEYVRARDAVGDLGPSLLERGRADHSIRVDVPLEHQRATLRGALHGLLEMEMRGELVRPRIGLPEVPNADCANMIAQILRPSS